MDPEALVRHYLGDLEAAAAGLTADRRAELVGDVREHIELALAEAGSLDEATVREVLARLGAPDEIVAAEIGSNPPGDEARREPWGGWLGRIPRQLDVEARALLLMTVGALLLPFVGPLLGLWVAAGSERWTLAQKRTATMIVLALLVFPALLLGPAIAAGELTWVVTTAGFALPFVPLAGIVAAIYLVVTSPRPTTVPGQA
jgi:HAAS